MRRHGLVIACATLCGCFSPKVGPDAEPSGSDTDASTGATMPTGVDASSGEGTETSGIDPDTTVGPGDTESETTVGDDPPAFESFTVNGSTRPAEVAEGGTITLEADATDDVGVVSVEFFDGDGSLGVVEDSPYELEVLVSSADSGSHTYRAVATDTAGQTADSDEVTLSINIVGGEVLFYRDQLFSSSRGLPGPLVAVSATSEGRVIVNGTIADTISGRILAFNEDLSSLWTDNEDAFIRAPAVDLGADVLISSWEDGTWRYTLRDLDSSEPGTSVAINVPVGDPIVGLTGSRATRGGAGVVISTLPNTLRTYQSDLTSPDWTHELPDDAILAGLAPLPGSGVLVTFNAQDQCAPGADTCLRRLQSTGDVDWTIGLPEPAVATTRADGNVISVSARSNGGFNYAEFDLDGEAVGPEVVLDEDRDYVELDGVAADGAGGLVVVGTLGPSNDRTAVVTRYDANGDQVWDQDGVATGPDSMGLGVVVFDDAAYVCGIEDLATAGLGVNGEVFAAKLRL